MREKLNELKDNGLVGFEEETQDLILNGTDWSIIGTLKDLSLELDSAISHFLKEETKKLYTLSKKRMGERMRKVMNTEKKDLKITFWEEVREGYLSIEKDSLNNVAAILGKYI